MLAHRHRGNSHPAGKLGRRLWAFGLELQQDSIGGSVGLHFPHISQPRSFSKYFLDLLSKANTIVSSDAREVSRMNHQYDTIDEAYAIFARTGPEFGGGLSNHGPMASEAIAAFGRPDEVMKWASRYAKRLEPHPSPSSRISEADWREALGKEHRVADWIVFFNEALKEAPSRDTLNRCVG